MFKDTSENHIVKGGNGKQRAEKHVFLSYESNKKSSHLSEKYEEISNPSEVIFFKEFQTAKERDTIAQQMMVNQKNAATE